MKILLAQPSNSRFRWELEVLLTNLQKFGKHEVKLLFSKPLTFDSSAPQYLQTKYGAQSFVYEDGRFSKDYIPSIRPYLLWQHFSDHPEDRDAQYLYIDSDVIFRQWPDFGTMPADPNVIYGADVSGYLDYNYIKRCQHGDEIAAKMAEICGITVEQMIGVPGIGAQLVLTSPDPAFWERSYDDSNKIHNYLKTVNTDLQKWTAEMWAQQWGWVREAKKLVHAPELDMSRPTDNIAEWDKFNVMHNAGVTGSGPMFFKGNYIDRVPWDEDFSGIDPNFVSSKYVEALKSVVF